MKLGRASLLCLLALCAFATPSCGVGGLLAGAAGGGGGGGGGGRKAPPPTVNVSLPGGDVGADLVTFKVRLNDPRVPASESPPRVRIEAEFAIGGGAFRRMTEAEVADSEGTRDLEVGAEHSFVWNSIVDVGGFSGTVRFRFSASYEDAEGISRRFVAFTGDFRLDNRLAGTIVGGPNRPDSDVDTFPIDVRPQGDAFFVASLGANIVERVDATGAVDRVAGIGIPGSIIGRSQAPGVVRLPLVFGLDVDAAGHVFTTHESSVVVTNPTPTSFTFGLVDFDGDSAPDTTVVPQRTTAVVIGDFRIPVPGGADIIGHLGPVLANAHSMRRHPTGALLLIDSGSQILAINPQDPSSPASTPIVLGGVNIGPGEVKTIIGGGASISDGAIGTDVSVVDGIALAIGPDGEIYWLERTPSRARVLNAGTSPLTIGGAVVQPGTVLTVAGTGAAADPTPAGTQPPASPATSTALHLPNGIAVGVGRVLFIADTNDVRVRAANLGDAPVTFAETTIAPGFLDTVVGGGTAGIGSKARAIALQRPNNVAVDEDGNLLVSDGHRVLFVNGSTVTVMSYGATAGAARVAVVYDSTERGGLLLVEPRALHSPTPEVLYFTDRTSVRVMNLTRTPAVFGGAAPEPGGSAILAGGAVAGFSGDGGPARLAAFSRPSALAASGLFLLFVADTGNDRVRVVNTDDPRLGPSAAHVAFGINIAAGDVATVVGRGPGPPLPQDGDGLAPTAASLSAPQGLVVSNAGLLFIADTGHERIRVVNPGPGDVTVAGLLVAAGTIRTVVGDGVPGFTPDGPGPWHVSAPTALAIDRELLYFADSGNAMIRVLNLSASTVHISDLDVLPNQVLTICGTGVRGNSGDFGLGIDAQIDTPRGFALQTLDDERAALYFSDGPQQVIRMLNLTSDRDLVGALDENGNVSITVPDASIVTLAGGPNRPGFRNTPGFDGDGRPAAEMRFAEPWGIAVTTFDGKPAHFFVADSRNDRIRRFGAPPLVK